MIKRFFIFSLFATILLGYVVFDILIKDNTILNSQLKFTKVTTIIEPSFSVAPIEDRFLYLKNSLNIYPTLPKIDKKGFVYAK